VNPTVSLQTLSALVNKLAPKRVLSPYDPLVIQPTTPMVIDTITKGQTRTLSEDDIGSLKYKGICPNSIASVIRMQSTGDNRMISRVTDIQLEFKDDQYHVRRIGEPSPIDQTPQSVDMPTREFPQSHLYFKLLDCKKQNRQMIQLYENVPDDTVIEQIVTKLNLNGYHSVRVETGGNR